MVLPGPEQRLFPGFFQQGRNPGRPAVIQGGDILVKGINPGGGQHRNERKRDHEQSGRLHEGLCEENAPPATGRPARRRFGGGVRPQPPRENDLPEFHPKKQRRHAQRGVSQMLLGKRAAAHVGPKIKQSQHKRNRAQIIYRQGGGRRGAQPVGGLFDEIEAAPALLPALFHKLKVQSSRFKVITDGRNFEP